MAGLLTAYKAQQKIKEATALELQLKPAKKKTDVTITGPVL
jgi:hypothetical protein